MGSDCSWGQPRRRYLEPSTLTREYQVRGGLAASDIHPFTPIATERDVSISFHSSSSYDPLIQIYRAVLPKLGIHPVEMHFSLKGPQIKATAQLREDFPEQHW